MQTRRIHLKMDQQCVASIFPWCYRKQAVEQTVESQAIQDAMTLMRPHCDGWLFPQELQKWTAG